MEHVNNSVTQVPGCHHTDVRPLWSSSWSLSRFILGSLKQGCHMTQDQKISWCARFIFSLLMSSRYNCADVIFNEVLSSSATGLRVLTLWARIGWTGPLLFGWICCWWGWWDPGDSAGEQKSSSLHPVSVRSSAFKPEDLLTKIRVSSLAKSSLCGQSK